MTLFKNKKVILGFSMGLLLLLISWALLVKNPLPPQVNDVYLVHIQGWPDLQKQIPQADADYQYTLLKLVDIKRENTPTTWAYYFQPGQNVFASIQEARKVLKSVPAADYFKTIVIQVKSTDFENFKKAIVEVARTQQTP